MSLLLNWLPTTILTHPAQIHCRLRARRLPAQRMRYRWAAGHLAALWGETQAWADQRATRVEASHLLHRRQKSTSPSPSPRPSCACVPCRAVYGGGQRNASDFFTEILQRRCQQSVRWQPLGPVGAGYSGADCAAARARVRATRRTEKLKEGKRDADGARRHPRHLLVIVRRTPANTPACARALRRRWCSTARCCTPWRR